MTSTTQPRPADTLFLKREAFSSSVRSRTVRGAAARLAANGATAGLNVFSTIFLARLLSPEEFGLFGMVIVLADLSRALIELGLGTVTVQKGSLTHYEVSALLWVNVTAGVVLMLAMMVLSPVAAWFYHDARLLDVCRLLSVVFLLNGLAIQHRSLLERQMHFGSLGIVNVCATSVATTIAICLAAVGYGVWALVWRELTNAAIYATGSWYFCCWRPSWPRRHVNLRANLRFGTDVSLLSVVQYFSLSVDRVLIGRLFGPIPLGLYTRAFALAMMPVEYIRMTVTGLALAPMSALRSDPKRYRHFYRLLLSAMCSVYMPVAILLIVAAEDVVVLLLGNRWLDAAPLLRVLAIGGAARPLLSTFQLVLLSSGKSRRYLQWGTASALCLMSACALGLVAGVHGVAYGYAVGNHAVVLWSLWYCLQDTPIDPPLVLRGIAIPLGASLGAGIVAVALDWRDSHSVLSNFLWSGAIIGVVYAGLWLCIPAGRQQLLEFKVYAGDLRRRRVG